jgi:hypothetical protein
MRSLKAISLSPESGVEAQWCLMDTNRAIGKRSHKVASGQAGLGKAFAWSVSTFVTTWRGWVTTGGGVLGGGACPSPST